jgi:hypothetical protein
MANGPPRKLFIWLNAAATNRSVHPNWLVAISKRALANKYTRVRFGLIDTSPCKSSPFDFSENCLQPPFRSERAELPPMLTVQHMPRPKLKAFAIVCILEEFSVPVKAHLSRRQVPRTCLQIRC